MSRNQGWKPHAVPGSIKPVYGARYPPLNLQQEPQISSPIEVTEKHKNNSADKQELSKFNKYNDSVQDAWDLGEDDLGIDRSAANTSAEQVLALHAASKKGNSDPSAVMVNLHTTPSRNSKVRAMQRLATQRELPGGAVQVNTHHHHHSPAASSSSLYPRLPTFDTSALSYTDDPKATPAGDSSNKQVTGNALTGIVGRPSPSSSMNEPNVNQSAEMTRYERLKRMLNPELTPSIDMEVLRRDCWKGIPQKLRPCAWRILSGYLPSTAERRQTTLKRKREEYYHFVEQYFHTRYDDMHNDTFRQIHIDIPRMCPLIPLFQQKLVQEIFERILFIWAIRHPASGYVQGINDLVAPFFVVFLSEFVKSDMEVGTFEVAALPREEVEIVEADSFWCVSALLDTIQDNYTFAQPGIQKKVRQLEHLVSRVDSSLNSHLLSNSIEYLQFAFRWMNNVLMREIPLRATIRLWDTYLSEPNGFSEFHVYVCAAFLRMWSKQLQQQKDFQNVMIMLQNLPTQAWGDQHICELTADAFSLCAVFAGSKNHLAPN